jgi:hypothetical protein
MNVCPDCFEQPGLGRRIASVRPKFSEGPCDFHSNRKGVPIKAVAEIVDPVFRELYAGGPDEGNVWVEDRGNLLVDVLLNMTGADDDAVIDALVEALVEGDHYWPPDGEEAFYDDEYRYFLLPGDLGHHGQSWTDFRRSLMFEQRFFNPDAEPWLTDIFTGVQQQRNAAGQGPVYMIEPSDDQARFFRARIANTRDAAGRILDDLASQLGPPPEQLRRAGRLNPAGILAFYAAFDLATCVAELRPSVGGGVAAAQFQITQPICVLDMTRFAEGPQAPNLFAPKALERGRQWRFMQMFMDEIAKPVFPSDEHLEYLPTQAVAEFLHKRFSVHLSGQQRSIDAIVFRSAQRPGGKNIVLLGDAAVVGEQDGGKRPVAVNDGPDSWFDRELAQAKANRPARILPIPETGIWQRVSGAEFQTQDMGHPGDLYEEF